MKLEITQVVKQFICLSLCLGLFAPDSVFAQASAKGFEKANDLIISGSLPATHLTRLEQVEKNSNDAIIAANFENSIGYWKNLLGTAPENGNYNYKLGLCYYFSYDQQLKALPYFITAFKQLSASYDFSSPKESRAPYSTLYFLADTYLENNQPDSAIKYFSLYQDHFEAMPINTERRLSMSLNAHEASRNPRNVVVSNMGNALNTIYAETNPVMRLDNKLLFFSSRRPNAAQTGSGTATFFNADIYLASKNKSGKWENPIPFKHNTAADEAPLYLRPNGDVLYFRRMVNNQFDIFKTEFSSNEWSKPQAIEEINSPGNEIGISITGDGNTMYFSSDQNKEKGKYDIFKCTKQKNGKWGKLELLGNHINTPFDEISPYISPDGNTLFFSSNGSSKMGLGSYDIYYSELKADGSWTEARSMGYPINKTRADLNYCVASEDKRYYATLTEENSYDIFLVEGGGFDFENIAAGTDVITVTSEMGVTQVMETEKEVEKEVEVKEVVETIVEKEKEVEVIKTLESDKDKEIEIAKMQDSLDALKKVNVSDVNVEHLSDSERALLVEKVKNYLASELKANESVKFKTVYFDFNKSNLNLLSLNELKLLVEFLGEHPETKIEIAGHGDNRGSWKTNLLLSNRRAKEVYEFLITNKVSSDRMFFYGKGSAVPIAPNDTDENRGKNRRVEVFILK